MENEVKIIFKGDSKQLTKAIQQLDNATKKLLKTQAKINDFNKKQEQIDNSRVNTFRRLNAQLKLKGSNLKAVGLSTSIYKKALEGNAWALERVKIATRKHIAELGQQRESFKKARVTSNSYQQSIQKAVNQQKKLKKGMFETTNSGRLLDNTFATLRSKILLFNFAMALGVRQLIQFSRQASQVESLSRAFTTLSGGTAKSEKALKKLRNATNNTVSDFNLLRQANNALVLGVAKNSDEMAELFDMAQRLGNALGKTADESIESLVTGIGRQSRQMLDNVGIVVQSNEAYKNYANNLNKSADSLTDVEKKQAFLNATLDSARKKIAELPIEIENSQTAFEQLDSVLANSAVQIGELLSPLVLYLASGYGNLAELIATKVTPAFSEFVKDILPLGSKETRDLIKKNKENLKTIKQLESAMTFFVDVMFSTSKAIREVSEEQKKYEQSIKSTTKLLSDDFVALKKQEQILLGVSEATAQATAEKEAMRIAMNIPEGQDFIHTIKESTEEQKKFASSIEELKRNIQVLNMSYGVFEKTQLGILEQQKAEQKNIEQFIQKYPEQAKALGLITKEQEKQNEGLKKQDRIRKTVLGKTVDFQIEQLKLLEKEFYASNERTLESEQYFADERAKIMKEEMKQRLDNNTFALSHSLNAFNSLTGSMEQDLERRKQNELNALKSTNAYQKASTEQRKNMEHELVQGFAENEMKIFKMKKASNLAQIAIDTASAVAEALPNIPLSVLIGTMGLAQAKIVASQKPPQFETGGLVGGRRHSQGGTMIEAEQGEFVMSRNAVQSIGVETLNQMNRSGTSGITVNISAPLVDETIVDTIIPAIRKAQRMNLA